MHLAVVLPEVRPAASTRTPRAEGWRRPVGEVPLFGKHFLAGGGGGGLGGGGDSLGGSGGGGLMGG